MSAPSWFVTRFYSLERFDTSESARELLLPIIGNEMFATDRFDWAEPLRQRISHENLDAVIEPLLNVARNQEYPENPNGGVYLERIRTPKCFHDLNWSGVRLAPFGISSYQIEEKSLRRNATFVDWLNLCFAQIEIHDTWYAYFSL